MESLATAPAAAAVAADGISSLLEVQGQNDWGRESAVNTSTSTAVLQQRRPYSSMSTWSMPSENATNNASSMDQLLEPNPIDYSLLWCFGSTPPTLSRVETPVPQTATPWREQSPPPNDSWSGAAPQLQQQQPDFSFPAQQQQQPPPYAGGSPPSQLSSLWEGTSAHGALPAPLVLPRMPSGIDNITGNSIGGKSNQPLLASFFSNGHNDCNNSLPDALVQQQQSSLQTSSFHGSMTSAFPELLQTNISNSNTAGNNNIFLFNNNNNININTDQVFLDGAEGSTNSCSMGRCTGSSALLPPAVVSLSDSNSSSCYAVPPFSSNSNNTTADNFSVAATLAKYYYEFLQQQQQQQQQQQEQLHQLTQHFDQARPVVASTASITTCSSLSSCNTILPTPEPLSDTNKSRKHGMSNDLASTKRTKKQNQHFDNKRSRKENNTASRKATGNNILPALSPYNFFFRDERERLLAQTLLLQNCSAAVVDELARASLPEGYYGSEEAKLCLLHKHWYRDRTVRRRHRKTHEQIRFSTLSKVIGNRWRSLSDEGKEFYRDVAARDAARQARQIAEQHPQTDSNNQDCETLQGPTTTENGTKKLKSHDLEATTNSYTLTVG